MSAYPILRLGDVANVVSGDPAPQDPGAFAREGPLFVRMQDVGRHHRQSALADSSDRLSAEWVARNRLRLFPRGSILIPKSGASVNLNHRAKLATEAYVVSHLAVVIPDRTRIDPDYLYWWSASYDPRGQAQVTSLPSLKLSALKSATVPVPPLCEQRRIAGILNRAAKLVRLRKQVQERLQEFVPALFIKMFGDPATNPKGWQEFPLGEVIRVSSGQGLSAKHMKPGIFPVYGGNGIAGYHSEFMFEDSKIVIGRVGANCGTVHLSRPKSWITDNALYVREIRKPVELTYLEWSLRVANLNQYAGRAAQPLVSGSRIYPVPIMLPDKTTQREFAQVVETADSSSRLVMSGTGIADKFTRSLMFRLLGAST